MRRVFPIFIFLAFVGAFLPGQQLRIAAYNTGGLGETRTDYQALARLLSNFDLVAAVQVMNAEGLEKVVTALDERWEGVMSEKENRARGLREFFGFIFNDRVELVKMLGAYPPPDTFIRPPYGAQFKLRGSRFAFNLVACHITQGAARSTEIFRLADVYRYFEKLTGNRGITILAGDFNDDKPRSFDSFLGGTDRQVVAVRGTMSGRRGADPGFDHMFASAALQPRIEAADLFSCGEPGARRLPVYLVLKAGR